MLDAFKAALSGFTHAKKGKRYLCADCVFDAKDMPINDVAMELSEDIEHVGKPVVKTVKGRCSR